MLSALTELPHLAPGFEPWKWLPGLPGPAVSQGSPGLRPRARRLGPACTPSRIGRCRASPRAPSEADVKPEHSIKSGGQMTARDFGNRAQGSGAAAQNRPGPPRSSRHPISAGFCCSSSHRKERVCFHLDFNFRNTAITHPRVFVRVRVVATHALRRPQT